MPGLLSAVAGVRAVLLLGLSSAQSAAARETAVDYEALQPGHRDSRLAGQAQRDQRARPRICALSAAALDYEAHRLADWLAWHSLIGIDCFVLLIDMLHSDLNDANNADLHKRLRAAHNPPFLTLREINATDDIIENDFSHNVSALVKNLDATFVLQIDIDEFVLVDPRETGNAANVEPAFTAMPAFANVTLPCSLRNHLVHIGADNAGGMRLQWHHFGTNGYLRPPSLHEMPEFGLLTSHEGLCGPVKHGKYVCNLRKGCDTMRGKHKWHVDEKHPMLMANGDVCAPPPEELRHHKTAHGHCRAEERTNLPVYINHYISSSYMHCAYRSSHGLSKRVRSEVECQQFHPGTEEYARMTRSCPFQRDELMRSYARATRIRVQQIFGDRSAFSAQAA